MINGERKEIGWFYIPNVRINRQATDEIEQIVTQFEKHHYAGTIIRSTVHKTTIKDGDAVTPEQADLINLTSLDFEAGWMVSVAGEESK